MAGFFFGSPQIWCERCSRDGAEVVTKGFTARGGYLDTAAALADGTCSRRGERRIFAHHARILVPLERSRFVSGCSS